MSTSAIGSIIRAARRRPGEPLNILTFSTHESYQSTLAELPHHFYLYEVPGLKTWNPAFRQLPANHTIVKDSLPPHVDLDLVLSQEASMQYPVARQLSKELQLPLIVLEHTLPHPEMTASYLQMLKKSQPCDAKVFISEYSREKWGWGEAEASVIHHGINTELFTPENSRGRERVLLSVVNDWINRDWCCGYKFWQEATEGLPVKVIGDTPGLSKPAGSVQELAGAFREAQIFVNSSTVSPVPTALLEAMASGCCVVTTANCMIPEVVSNGVNGVLCENPQHMRANLIDLLEHPGLCEAYGVRARETILQKFSNQAFLRNWDQYFQNAVSQFTPGRNI